ncbi:hypothetical protein STRDD11_00020 [Streptococcus sp. DD11]|nr:hypothetical protein STRDD11_00020 [Streptococcus sp. DD11]
MAQAEKASQTDSPASHTIVSSSDKGPYKKPKESNLLPDCSPLYLA